MEGRQQVIRCRHVELTYQVQYLLYCATPLTFVIMD